MFARLMTISTTGHSCNTKQKRNCSTPLATPLQGAVTLQPDQTHSTPSKSPGKRVLYGTRQQLGCCEGLGGSGASLELWCHAKGDHFDLGNISGIALRAETRREQPGWPPASLRSGTCQRCGKTTPKDSAACCDPVTCS